MSTNRSESVVFGAVFSSEVIRRIPIMKKQWFVLAATACLVALVMLLWWQWVFMRFWLYHSQNRNLSPDDYKVRVLTASEYEQLLNPGVREVRFANGSQTFVKAADRDWEAKAKTRYKSVYDGKYYVEVITKGTAHVLVRWYRTFVPAALFSSAALLSLVAYHLKTRQLRLAG